MAGDTVFTLGLLHVRSEHELRSNNAVNICSMYFETVIESYVQGGTYMEHFLQKYGPVLNEKSETENNIQFLCDSLVSKLLLQSTSK